MKTAELCAGYSGLHLAIHALNPAAELAWYAESDPAPAEIMAHHHPGVPNLGDITAVDWSSAEPVDVLAAGFPCQPMSQAGLRRGAKDERHLWPTGVLPAISALRTPVVVLENVPGILTIDRGDVFRTILSDLDQLGYTTRWTTVGACMVGACHHRHRVFVAAARARLSQPDDSLFGASIASVRKWPPAGHVAAGQLWPLPAQTCGASGVTLPTPGARLGDDRGDPGPELAATRIASGRRNLDDALALLPTPRASDGTKGGPNQRGSSGDLALPAAVQPERWGQYAAAVARHELVFGAAAPDQTVEGVRGGRRLAPAFVEWLMGLPRGWVTGVDIGRNAQLKALGNGVVPAQAAYALRQLGFAGISGGRALAVERAA